jgi:hypothetical protein
MRTDNPSPENGPPGSGEARTGAPEAPWQEVGDALTSVMTAWADLTTGWASLVTAWMRASGSWTGFPMNPFRAGSQAAASWARQAMECMARYAPTARGQGPSVAPATPEPPAPARPHRGDTSEGLPPLADGT